VEDITRRLTPDNVARHPLLLLEAVDVIGALRAELDRERRWVNVLERAMIHNLKAGHDSKNREKREE
jgi:hypothetical protein